MRTKAQNHGFCKKFSTPGQQTPKDSPTVWSPPIVAPSAKTPSSPVLIAQDSSIQRMSTGCPSFSSPYRARLVYFSFVINPTWEPVHRLIYKKFSANRGTIFNFWQKALTPLLSFLTEIVGLPESSGFKTNHRNPALCQLHTTWLESQNPKQWWRVSQVLVVLKATCSSK